MSPGIGREPVFPSMPDRSAWRKIAVIRMLRGLGDLLCAVPALRALRAALPDAHIALVGLPSARAFVRRFGGYVDELIESPGFPGIPERTPNIAAIPDFLASMQRRSFDLAIQMHGNGAVTNTLLLLLKARNSAGFFEAGRFCPNPETFLPYVENQSEIVRCLALMEFLGLGPGDGNLEFPLWKNDREELARLPGIDDLRRGEYVCIHPGAHDPSRRWPVVHFASVADGLAALGMSVALTGGIEESGTTRQVARAMRHQAIDLAGQTSLGSLGALLADARLLICNDTGISHLAAALHVPSVVIFTNSNPSRWAPLNSDLHRPVAVRGPLNGGVSAGMRLPSVDEVRAEAKALLLRERFAEESRRPQDKAEEGHMTTGGL